ncbi:MAG: hypothetical protein J6K64_04280 [Clostridia bacterium]|nr:hypothetical protein [Clostridia bacterium]
MNRKMTKLVSCVVACVLMLNLCMLFANATGISPYYHNAIWANSSADVSSTGVLTVKNTYSAQSTTTKVVITTYIEKRVLGIFWSKVDIGTSNDEWVDTVYTTNYSGSHTHRLEKTGTYRVTIEYVFYGTDGSVDTIEKEIEKTY